MNLLEYLLILENFITGLQQCHSMTKLDCQKKYLNLSNNAFSPGIAEAKKLISEEPSSIKGLSKRDCFTHLANIFEAACKHCFTKDQEINHSHIGMALEAAIRGVLCYKSDNTIAKFIDKLHPEDPIYKFHQYLLLAYEEPTSEEYLREISNHTGVVSKKISSFFNFDLSYTNSVKTLIKLSKCWKECLKSDSDSKWLHSWFLERRSTGYQKLKPELKPEIIESTSRLNTIEERKSEEPLKIKPENTEAKIIQNAVNIFKHEGLRAAHDYETDAKLNLLKLEHQKNGNKLIIREDKESGDVYNKNDELIYIEYYKYGELIKRLKIVEISYVTIEPF